jgi:hypothetical protein
MFQNKVLRRVFGLKREDLTGLYRKLRSKELHNLYSNIKLYVNIEG